MSTKIEIDDDQVSIALVRAAGGEWQPGPCKGDKVLMLNLVLFALSLPSGELDCVLRISKSKDLLQEHIFPVIRDRGKWGNLKKFLVEDFERNAFRVFSYSDYLLTLPARTLAEKCLEVLKE